MKNLINFLFFMALCITAHSIMNISLFDISPNEFKSLLGTPPPIFLINIALAVYIFSSFTLKISSILFHKQYEFNFHDLGYCAAFLFFYSLSGALSVNLIAVVIVGTLNNILNLIHYTQQIGAPIRI